MANFKNKRNRTNNQGKQQDNSRNPKSAKPNSTGNKPTAQPKETNQSNRENRAFDINNPAWYTRYMDLIKDAASVSYAYPNGVDLPFPAFSVGNEIDAPVKDGSWINPGVCVLDTVCHVPFTISPDDPVNVSGTNTFLYLRRGKSGNAPYDAADISMLLFAAAHIYSAVNWLQRIYGLAQVFATTNKYLPADVLTADQVDWANIKNNLGNFRYGINEIIHKAAALILPSQQEVPLFSRTAFMFSNVYIESGSIKDQLYLYHPLGFYKYSPTEVSEGVFKPTLEFKALPAGLLKCDDLLDYVNDLLEFVYGDTDVATMMSDISNAYGDNIIKMQILSEDYKIEPTYDIFVLDQIHNAETFPAQFFDPDSFFVEEDTDDAGSNSYVKSTPALSFVTPTVDSLFIDRFFRNPAARYVLTDASSPITDWFVDATRLMPEILVDSGAYYLSGCTETIFGFRICTRARATAANPVPNTLSQWKYSEIGHNYYLNNNAQQNANIEATASDYRVARNIIMTAIYTKCQYAPKFYMNIRNKAYTAEDAAVTRFEPMFDIDNYGIIYSGSLGKLHNACLFGLLSLPLSNLIY